MKELVGPDENLLLNYDNPGPRVDIEGFKEKYDNELHMSCISKVETKAVP
jgi:hypothetical protein